MLLTGAAAATAGEGAAAGSAGGTGAWAAGASGGLLGISSAITTAIQNKKQRAWQEEQTRKANEYNRQQWEDANKYNEGMWTKQNEYNEKLWHMQNAYNSPAEQMKRYKEAGLNPNLIYGQSNMGGSVADSRLPAAAPSEGNVPRFEPKQIGSFDLSSGIFAYNNFRQSQAQLNNLAAENAVKQAQARFININSAKVAAETDYKGNLNKLLTQTLDYQTDAWRLKNENTQSAMDNRTFTQSLARDQFSWKQNVDRSNMRRVDQGIKESNARINKYGFDQWLGGARLDLDNRKFAADSAYKIGEQSIHKARLSLDRERVGGALQNARNQLEFQRDKQETDTWMRGYQNFLNTIGVLSGQGQSVETIKTEKGDDWQQTERRSWKEY